MIWKTLAHDLENVLSLHTQPCPRLLPNNRAQNQKRPPFGCGPVLWDLCAIPDRGIFCLRWQIISGKISAFILICTNNKNLTTAHKLSHGLNIFIIKIWWPVSKGLPNLTIFWIKPFLEIGIYWWRCTMKELWATSRQIAPVVVATTSAARFLSSIKYSFALCYQLITCPVPWRNMENGISASSVNSFILCLQLLGAEVRGT